MAKRTITQTVFEDDLTGQAVEEADLNTIRFTVEGVQYEIDLTDPNADKFRAAMGEWTKVARRVGGRKTPAATNGAGPTSIEKNQNREIRDWARSQGLDVPPRGRIPASIREQFELARAS